MAHGAMAEGMC